MKRLKRRGLSYQSIGKLFGVSRQRIHQLISGYVEPNRRKNCKKYHWLDVLFQSILQRDNFKCQRCLEGAILIHHVDGDNYNNDPSNLISLCRSCHLSIHSPIRGKSKGRKVISLI